MVSKRFLYGLCLLAVPVLGHAETNSYASERLSVTTSTVKVTTAANLIPRSSAGDRGGGTNYAFITVETNSIRFKVDGSSPTTSSGHAVASGGNFTIVGYNDVRNLKMIGSGSTAADVEITYGIQN